MKIAIQNNTTGFHPRWIEACEKRDIPFKLVNVYDNDIIDQLKDCDALMWHHNHSSPKDVLFAKPLLFSLQQAGKVVFPDFNTGWHFDDKVGQKYLLESLDISLVPSYVFYEKDAALQWAYQTDFPKVFKLRGGAGAANVKLARSRKEARKLIKQAFGKGFSQYDPVGSLKERFRKFKTGKGSLKDMGKGIVRFAYPPRFAKVMGRDVSYVYFQDYIPDNDSDIRVIVIDDKAFAIKRMVRENDFRASGSGSIKYEKEHFSDEIIELSFKINDKICSQSLAIDFVFDNGHPKVVEISYGFIKTVYDPCVGYWDRNLNFHEAPVDFCSWMVEIVVSEVERRKEVVGSIPS